MFGNSSRFTKKLDTPLAPSVLRSLGEEECIEGSALSVRGFSLIELVVAIMLIAMMATLVVPRFGGRTYRAERDKFVNKFNTMVQLAYQNALSTGKLHRVLIDIDKKKIKLEIESGKDSQNNYQFATINIPYVKSELNFEDFEIINLYLKKDDKLTGRARTREAWFFISPGGMAQEVTLNIRYLKNPENINTDFALVLNPFTVQFKTYDEFQKP